MSEVMQNPNPNPQSGRKPNSGARPSSGSSSGLQKFLKTLGRGLKNLLLAIGRGIAIFFRGLKRFFHKIHLELRKFHRGNMRRFTKWVDPRLEKYRPAGHKLADAASSMPSQASETAETPAAADSAETTLPPAADQSEAKPSDYNHTSTAATALTAPKSQAEFLKLLQMTPRDVLDYRARQIITMAFQLPKTHASDLMLP